jgi:hypothetical protein
MMRKFTSIAVTRMSMPRKNVPAKCEPSIPMEATIPLSTIATCGVCRVACTLATARGKMPSSAHANMSRDTASSIAGRSFVSAIAAPATISTVHPGASTKPNKPGAVTSRVAASRATYSNGTV